MEGVTKFEKNVREVRLIYKIRTVSLKKEKVIEKASVKDVLRIKNMGNDLFRGG